MGQSILDLIIVTYEHQKVYFEGKLNTLCFSEFAVVTRADWR